jgi:heme A synthase
VTSGVALLLVVGMVYWAFRAYPRQHTSPVRAGAIASLVFILIEALIGAGLVLFELVADNASVARALWMAAHLVNTFLLLGALTLTVWWALTGERFSWWGQGRVTALLSVSVLGMLVLGASGAVAALGDTIYLSLARVDGTRQAASATADFLIGLRVYHPFIAILVGLLMTGTAILLARWRPGRRARRLAALLVMLFAVQMGVGVTNVLLLAPTWIQLVHLALADAVWITFVLLGAVVCAQEMPASTSVRRHAATQAQEQPAAAG